ncbi:hypothetical protein ABZS66_56865 [Dactylosporangium sp. NPDC005572]
MIEMEGLLHLTTMTVMLYELMRDHRGNTPILEPAVAACAGDSG